MQHNSSTCRYCGKDLPSKPAKHFCNPECYWDSMRQPREMAFWAKVQKTSSCWLWLGPKWGCYGYGEFRWQKSRAVAHRFSYELAYGPIPDGMFVCHKCDVAACVNPEHLFLGTPADNSADMVAKHRQACGDRSPSRLHPNSRPKGAEVWRAKLTDAEVIAIRERYSPKARHCALLARQYGVTPTAIFNIVHNKTWRHLLNASVDKTETPLF